MRVSFSGVTACLRGKAATSISLCLCGGFLPLQNYKQPAIGLIPTVSRSILATEAEYGRTTTISDPRKFPAGNTYIADPPGLNARATRHSTPVLQTYACALDLLTTPVLRKEMEASESGTAECPVCLASHPLRDLLLTKCEHKFCKSYVGSILKAADATCPLCRREITPYDTTRLSTGQALAERPTTIFGGVYIQGGTLGLASYHFSEQESYISYSAAPRIWRLDDGSPPPAKKPFLHATYDASCRTFRAVVDWSDNNCHGNVEWIYRMVFSEDFRTIEKGEVIAYEADRRKGEWHAYEQDLFYVRHEEIDFNQ